MAVDYQRTSPYYNSSFTGEYLDVANLPVIPKLSNDVVIEINKTYQYRPDLLAFDLYGDPSLWWVFAIRNPNVIYDPVFDMRIGRKIAVPKKETLQGIIK
jgi:hypothetical protein